MNLIFASETDRGNKRPANEDYLWPPDTHPYRNHPQGMLFIVADGMGGHGAGDVASRLATETIQKAFYAADNSETKISQRLEGAIQAAHQKVRQKATESPDLTNMGTTIVAAVVQNQHIWIAWVGDSRAYRFRNDTLSLVTQDHSKIWPLIQQGLTWDEVHEHPERSRITNSIKAGRQHVTVDIIEFPLKPGDVVLLCTDGLHGEVRDSEIAEIIRAHNPPQMVEQLIAKAKEPTVWQSYNGQRKQSQGGQDNISAIVLEAPGREVKAASPLPVVVPKGAIPIMAVAGIIGLLLIGGLGLAWYFMSGSPDEAGEMTAASQTAEAENGGSSLVGLDIEVAATPTPSAGDGAAAAENEGADTSASETEPQSGPTSTRASLPSPTPTPTATPTSIFSSSSSQEEEPTRAAPRTIDSTDMIEPLEPKPSDVLPNGIKQFTFKWRYGFGCNLPSHLGFEVQVRRDNAGPFLGIFDAKDPTQVSCNRGVYSHEVGDFQGGDSGRFYWQVLLVDIEGEYTGESLVDAGVSTFEIAGEGGGGGGSNGGGGGGGGPKVGD